MQSNPHCLSSLQKNKKAFGTIVQYIYILYKLKNTIKIIPLRYNRIDICT